MTDSTMNTLFGILAIICGLGFVVSFVALATGEFNANNRAWVILSAVAGFVLSGSGLVVAALTA